MADFSKARIDPLLTTKASSLGGTASVTSGNGAVAIAYTAPGSSYDYGVQRLVTTFSVTGDFVAHVTLQTTGYLQAGLEMFSGTAPAQFNPSGALTSFNNDATIFGNSGQQVGYQRPTGYGSGNLAYTTLDLELRRTGTLVEQRFDRHDGRGYWSLQPGTSPAGLSGGVQLALYLANTSGAAKATFSNFTITSQSVADTPVPAVPEPASWALMIGGFGLVGGALRSARRTAVLAA